jgi:8-oxo-dGTP diphosphatase
MPETTALFDSLPGLPQERRWRSQKNPMPGVIAILRRREESQPDRYLLIQRRFEPYAGKWALVGGGWDFGELVDTAILREVREETGLVAEFIALRGLVNERIAPQTANDLGGHYLLFVCELEANQGEAREVDEGPVAWFSKAELEASHQTGGLVPTDYAILARFAFSQEPFQYLDANVLTHTDGSRKDWLVSFESGFYD